MRLFLPIKDKNARKELSAATISRWICTTIVDSHAALEKSKSLPKLSKLTLFTWFMQWQLFNKVDLQSMMKAGRWYSGGMFTSFYLRELCPQTDPIHKTGPVVALGGTAIIKSSSWVSYTTFLLLAKGRH